MFGIGMPEMIIILAVALIVFGPKKLPELAQSLGKSILEFKKATQDFKESMDMKEDVKAVTNTFSQFHSDINQSITQIPDETKPLPNTTEISTEDSPYNTILDSDTKSSVIDVKPLPEKNSIDNKSNQSLDGETPDDHQNVKQRVDQYSSKIKNEIAL